MGKFMGHFMGHFMGIRVEPFWVEPICKLTTGRLHKSLVQRATCSRPWRQNNTVQASAPLPCRNLLSITSSVTGQRWTSGMPLHLMSLSRGFGSETLVCVCVHAVMLCFVALRCSHLFCILSCLIDNSIYTSRHGLEEESYRRRISD